MATKGEQYERLVGFFVESFSPDELEIFLVFNNFHEVKAAVSKNAAAVKYSFEVVQELDHLGLINPDLFDRLKKKFPAREEDIKSLEAFCCAEAPNRSEPSGSTTSSGPGKDIPTEPATPQRQSPEAPNPPPTYRDAGTKRLGEQLQSLRKQYKELLIREAGREELNRALEEIRSVKRELLQGGRLKEGYSVSDRYLLLDVLG